MAHIDKKQKSAEDEAWQKKQDDWWQEQKNSPSLVPQGAILADRHARSINPASERGQNGGLSVYHLEHLADTWIRRERRYRHKPTYVNFYDGNCYWHISGATALEMARAEEKDGNAHERFVFVKLCLVDLNFPVDLVASMMEFVAPLPRALALQVNIDCTDFYTSALVVCSDESTPQEIADAVDVVTGWAEERGNEKSRLNRQCHFMVEQTGAVLRMDRPLSVQKHRVDSMMTMQSLPELCEYTPTIRSTCPVVVQGRERGDMKRR